jgi:hypothetical protein
MLRSSLCSIRDMADKELMDVGECPYDQVGDALLLLCYLSVLVSVA